MQTIEQLKNRLLIWQGVQSLSYGKVCRSHYPSLDRQLAGGLPSQGIIEIRTPLGIGELRLLLPYLNDQQQKGMVIFIAPPALLSAESLALAQLDLNNVIIIEATEEEALWCAEQCLKSGCCSSVILWHQHFEVYQIRRFTLACEKGDSALFILRDPEQNQFSLPVHLTLSLTAHPDGIDIRIDKRKAGRPSEPFNIDMSCAWPDLAIPAMPENVVPITQFRSRAS